MPEIEKCPCAGCRDKREARLRTELASLTEDKRILSGQLFDCRKERKMALDRELSVRTELASQAAKIEAVRAAAQRWKEYYADQDQTVANWVLAALES